MKRISIGLKIIPEGFVIFFRSVPRGAANPVFTERMLEKCARFFRALCLTLSNLISTYSIFQGFFPITPTFLRFFSRKAESQTFQTLQALTLPYAAIKVGTWRSCDRYKNFMNNFQYEISISNVELIFIPQSSHFPCETLVSYTNGLMGENHILPSKITDIFYFIFIPRTAILWVHCRSSSKAFLDSIGFFPI